MRRMRNVLAHRYFNMNLPIIWQTIETDLPSLIEQIQRMLATEN